MNSNVLCESFKAHPAVYAVGREYQITVVTNVETLMWVRVGDEEFYDDSNGIIRSGKPVHKMTVPAELLDSQGGYTVCFRRVIERKPYYSETEDITEINYTFRPVTGENIRIYHISDAHNKVDSPVGAGEYFGNSLDLLILNGDIPNHSGDIANFDAIHEIAGRITKGEIPAVFSRGNHDTRGIHAEDLADYTPTDGGSSYFTFRLGGLWGMVLDCGEDKDDSSVEYGNTICCHWFRQKQTRFIEGVIANAEKEYLAPGVTKRMVVCHIPFTYIYRKPFDIEKELYAHWTGLLREHVKPDFILCGHMHCTEVWYPGGEHDDHGQSCPVIIGSDPFLGRKDMDVFVGCAIEYGERNVKVRFTDQDKAVVGEEEFGI
ncbi:MAG: metallophosphoesterase [Clostridia bacterium]|nr:metallophosphoesterase [Clostridia bacterium]